MSLAQLRLLAADLETDESGNELVSYIYNDAHQDTGARAFVDKYADPIVRARVFEGTTVNGGRVSLGTPAACLKNALQRRYVAGVKNNQPNIFKPVLAYHITSSEQTMRSILSTGFRVGDGTAGGYGTYFYSDRKSAEDYIPAGGNRRGRRRQSMVLEVTVYSHVLKGANYNDGYGGGTWANNFMGKIVTVKNPLLIFPQAVFSPGR
jgi:hypothetical protein